MDRGSGGALKQGALRPMEIRAPLPSEHEAIRSLLESCGWAHRIRSTGWLSELLARSRCAVAIEDGAVVGFARGITDGLSNGYLSMVAVAPIRQHHGIGSALVRHVTGDDPAITWVLRADRPGARPFFERLGFAASSTALERTRQGRTNT